MGRIEGRRAGFPSGPNSVMLKQMEIGPSRSVRAVFEILDRLILFVLAIWIIRMLIRAAGRVFGGSPTRSRVHQPPRPTPADPGSQKLDLSKDDVIDVTYTEVDPKP